MNKFTAKTNESCYVFFTCLFSKYKVNRQLHLLVTFFFLSFQALVLGQNCDSNSSGQSDFRNQDPPLYKKIDSRPQDVQILEVRLNTGDPFSTCTFGTLIEADLIIAIDHNKGNPNRHFTAFGDFIDTIDNTTYNSVRCAEPLLKSAGEPFKDLVNRLFIKKLISSPPIFTSISSFLFHNLYF